MDSLYSLYSLLVSIARILLAAIASFLFWSGAAVLSWLLLPVVRLRGRGRWERARVCQSAVRRAFCLFHAFMHRTGLLDYDYRRVGALPAELAGRPFVMVANHPSLIDVTALAAAWDTTCVVAKQPLFRSLLVGRLLRYCDHIDGGDGSAVAGAAVIDEALARLKGGLPVLVFPEGTRSPAGSTSLHPFKRGAFEIACRAGVPILPVLVRLDRPILLKGQRWYQSAERRRVRLTVESLAPIAVPANSDSAALARRVEAIFRKTLNLGVEEMSASARPEMQQEPVASLGRAMVRRRI
jgi:1-acyl-sn-glycerol-3-phosphate acyltransferase